MEKIKCSKCGQYHNWESIEVTFKYPDDYFNIPEEEREQRIKRNNEICIIDEKDYYVRGVIPIKTKIASKDEYCWGVWIKIETETYKVIYDNWELENQSHLINLKGLLANEIKFYKQTLFKDMSIMLTGNKTRPKFFFVKDQRLTKIQSKQIAEKDLLDIYHFYFND